MSNIPKIIHQIWIGNPNIMPINWMLSWKYLNPKFTPDLVHSNFNGSLNVCYWITNKITNQRKLQQIEKLDTTYVFNWGNIPIGTMDGIQPNAEIKALIKTSKNLKKQQITDMKNFIEKL